MKVEVSNGELVDKYTILCIKEKLINDTDKILNIKKELEEITPLVLSLNLEKNIIDDLYCVNLKLWDIEDLIRDKEKKLQFDDEFIQIARSVYITNSERFSIKQKINKMTNSLLREEKSH